MKRFGFAAACAAALLLFVAAYASSFGNALHFDDSHVVESNLNLRSLDNVVRFFTDASTSSSYPPNASYRPLVTLSLALDFARAGASGRDAELRALRISQLTLMALLGGLLVVLFRRWFDAAVEAPENRWLALFAASLFCIHTVNTETLNLMHARSEILSALGVVGAFLVCTAPARWWKGGLGSLPMALGALAKPPAVVFGPLWAAQLGIESWARGLRAGRWLRSMLPALLPIVLGTVVFRWVSGMDGDAVVYGNSNRLHYAQTQAWAWVHYLRLLVLPFGLSADTDLTLIERAADTRVAVGVLTILGLVWGAWRAMQSVRLWPVAFGLAWFALALAPTSSVMPLAEPVNEHRIFLPWIGLIPALTWGGWRWLADRPGSRVRDRRVLAGAALILLVAHAAGTAMRNRVWRSDESLWRDVTLKSPGNGRGWMNYGLALMRRADYAGARVAFERAAPLVPNYEVLEINRGILDGAEKRSRDAEAHFRRAISLRADLPAPHFYFGRWLVGEGRAPEALPYLETAVRLAPANPEMRALLTDVHAARGDLERSRALAVDTLRLAPGDARARAFAEGRVVPRAFVADSASALLAEGMRLGAAGDFVGSALAYRATLERNPDSPEALNNLGWTLGKLGFFAEAVPPLEAALRMRQPFELASNNLAWVKNEAVLREP